MKLIFRVVDDAGDIIVPEQQIDLEFDAARVAALGAPPASPVNSLDTLRQFDRWNEDRRCVTDVISAACVYLSRFLMTRLFGGKAAALKPSIAMETQRNVIRSTPT